MDSIQAPQRLSPPPASNSAWVAQMVSRMQRGLDVLAASQVPIRQDALTAFDALLRPGESVDWTCIYVDLCAVADFRLTHHPSGFRCHGLHWLMAAASELVLVVGFADSSRAADIETYLDRAEREIAGLPISHI